MMTQLTELVNSVGPDVLYLVLLTGVWFAITAIYIPGLGVPETGALVCLLFAVAGMIYLPTNVLGLLLIVIGMACFLVLAVLRRYWGLIVAGFALQIVGSILLFQAGARPSVWTILFINAGALAYHQIILLPGLRVQERQRSLDPDTLVGQEAQVMTTIDPVGTVRLEGEMWSASADRVITPGQPVRVVAREGLHLKVAPLASEESWPGDGSGRGEREAAARPEARPRLEPDMRLLNAALLAILAGGTLLAALLEGIDRLQIGVLGPLVVIAFGLFLLATRRRLRLRGRSPSRNDSA